MAKSTDTAISWRNDIFHKHFTKKDLGLEIGPSHSPIVAKKEGFNVRIVDHASKQDLIKKYKRLKISTDRVEEVDYVWSGNKTLSELVNKPKSFDYIIASHLVEHTTDLITFLQDCQGLLKNSGKLCLAIPDKRYCFDYFRFPTTAGDLLDAYYKKHVRHTSGKVFDFIVNSTSRGKDPAWSAGDTRKHKLMYDLRKAKTLSSKALKNSEYIDIHNWMFTPASFKLLIHDLQSLGLTKLAYVDELSTQGFEFFVTLSPGAKLSSTPRIKLVNNMMNDIREMLGVETDVLRAGLSQSQEKVAQLEAEIATILNSKRWRYTEKPAQLRRLWETNND